MKRASKIAALCAVLLLALTLPVCAEQTKTDPNEWYAQQLADSGADQLAASLPAETRALLETLGLYDLSGEIALRSPQTVLSALWDLFDDRAAAPLSAAALMAGTLLLLALFSSVQDGLRMSEEMRAVVGAVGALALAITLIVPLWQSVQRVQAACESASVFSLSFAPVYGAILASQGAALSAVSYQTTMLAASQGISLLIGSCILPAMTVSLSLGVAGSLSPGLRIGEAGSMINKTAVWLLAITMSVFAGLLSVQTLVGACADSAGGRVLRFSLASFVPVVGGSLSEALYTVRGCLSSLRGTVGGFGVLCTLLIVLPTLMECIAWNVCLFVCKTLAALFSLPSIEAVMGIASSVIKVMIGALCANALLMIISLTVLLTVGG